MAALTSQVVAAESPFAELDRAHAEGIQAYPSIARHCGAIALGKTYILDNPAGLPDGRVITNPSQVERTTRIVGGRELDIYFVYVRQEPEQDHLGRTCAVPYILEWAQGHSGPPRLIPFDEAKVLPGEDPRITPRVGMKAPSGSVYNGWLVSTTVARPRGDGSPQHADITQVIYWGTKLSELEPVLELPGLKNTCVAPVSSGSASLHVAGRPHPHVTYTTVNGLGEITAERVQSGIPITRGLLPEGVYTGANFIYAQTGAPGVLELQVHEAYRSYSPDQPAALHYRLARYAYVTPSREQAQGLLIPIGVVATRASFPDAEPKPPDEVNYYDVLYGSPGRRHAPGMVTGVSDRYIGYATLRGV